MKTSSDLPFYLFDKNPLCIHSSQRVGGADRVRRPHRRRRRQRRGRIGKPALNRLRLPSVAPLDPTSAPRPPSPSADLTASANLVSSNTWVLASSLPMLWYKKLSTITSASEVTMAAQCAWNVRPARPRERASLPSMWSASRVRCPWARPRRRGWRRRTRCRVQGRGRKSPDLAGAIS
jgi:hypothetical protein